MQILETKNAFLTPYEVFKVVLSRKKDAKKYKDQRDENFFYDTVKGEKVDRVLIARNVMLDSLAQYSPTGLSKDDIKANDMIGLKIKNFVNDILEILPSLSGDIIRELIAHRPENERQLVAVFPSFETFDKYRDNHQDIIDLVGKHLL